MKQKPNGAEQQNLSPVVPPIDTNIMLYPPTIRERKKETIELKLNNYFRMDFFRIFLSMNSSRSSCAPT
eukprot:m.54253 g.54253  ORF g.54253 m.54253 type:complete len:69 (-) comp18494_c0_seq3:35-241(-)